MVNESLTLYFDFHVAENDVKMVIIFYVDRENLLFGDVCSGLHQLRRAE